VNLQGQQELLGMWMMQHESSKFWLSVMTEPQNRGLKDILIACCDGLTGFPDAIEAVFPKTQVQLCMVHMVRNSLSYVSYKEHHPTHLEHHPRYLLFKSWDHLLTFMIEGLELEVPPNSS
jgi:transposase-like protein